MSKAFNENLVYVFTKKKYSKWAREIGHPVYTWANEINGMTVEIRAECGGQCKCYSVLPEWCKCISTK